MLTRVIKRLVMEIVGDLLIDAISHSPTITFSAFPGIALAASKVSSRIGVGCFRSILILGSLAVGLVITRSLHGSAIFLLQNTAEGETCHLAHRRPRISPQLLAG